MRKGVMFALVLFGVFAFGIVFALEFEVKNFIYSGENATFETNFSHLNISDPTLIFYMPFNHNHSSGIVYDYS